MVRIRELRESRGISQEQLSKDLDIKQQTLYKYEHGIIDMKVGTLIRIADYFHATLDYLANRKIILPSDRRFMVCEENLAICNLTEAHLLHLFRQIPKEYQTSLIDFLGIIENQRQIKNRY